MVEKWKRKPRKTESYCERGCMSGELPFFKPHTYVCRNCNFTAKRNHQTCPVCEIKGSMIDCGLTARPPRKRASKKKWKHFWEVEVPNSHPKGCR